MKADHNNDRTLDILIFELLDGTISPENHGKLQDILMETPEARSRYLELASTHNLLELVAVAPMMVSIPDPLSLKGPANQPLARRPYLKKFRPLAQDGEHPPKSRQRLNRGGGRFMRMVQRNHRPMALAALVLAPVLGFLCWKMVPAAPSARITASSDSVYKFQQASGDASRPRHGVIHPGTSVELTQGSLELNFSSGVRGVFQAPETITFTHERQLNLKRGAAWFHVPREAAGFEVVTPKLQIIDLGTEFGVVSRADGSDEIHVLKGKVEAAVLKGKSIRELLSAGQSRAVSPDGNLVDIETKPSLFQTRLPEAPHFLHWSFDEPDTAHITASGNHPAADSLRTTTVTNEDPAAFTSVPGKFGRALASAGKKGYLETNWPGIDGSSPRTVAYWLKIAPGQSCLNPIVGWGDRNQLRSFFTYVKTLPQGVVTAASCDSFWIEGTTPIDDGKWHHLAVIYTGHSNSEGDPEILCYVDGKPEPVTRHEQVTPFRNSHGEIIFDTITRGQGAIPVTLFTDMYSDRRPAPMSPTIEIDELHIIQSSLAVKQIGQLMNLNAYRPEPASGNNP